MCVNVEKRDLYLFTKSSISQIQQPQKLATLQAKISKQQQQQQQQYIYNLHTVSQNNMPPFATMDTYNLESATTSPVYSSATIQPTLTKDDQTIPQLSFEGLLQQGGGDLASCKLPFVWKLYEMLEGVEQSGEEHIVSWVQNGRAFRVHKLDEFVKDIVPTYFKQSKYKSFQRQLNFYGFTRITTGPNTGAYYHDQFLKGQKTMCLSIRPKASTSAKKQSKRKATPKKTTLESSSSEEHWMPQIQNLLKHGADHSLKQQDSQVVRYPPTEEAQPDVAMSSTRVVPFAPVPQQQEVDFCDGDACTIFGNMTFHFVEKRRR